MSPLLTVDGLTVEYVPAEPVLREVSLTVDVGEIVAVVGESGSGKTTLARTVLGLLPSSARVTGGSADLAGTVLTDADARTWRALRGRLLGYVPQDPGTSLNPSRRVGSQVVEALRAHRIGRARDEEAVRALTAAGLREPERVARAWPHELSGGMRQRALIAGAFVAGPRLIVADEPT
ncbi:MAG: ATP-binding cassette domain-containing protein, partial [Microbacterium sp.]